MHLKEQGVKRPRNQIKQTMVEVDNPREEIAKPQASNAKNSNFRKTPNCEVCKKYGHSTERCFKHPIKGEENLKNAKFCLLCRSKKHLSPECHLYPNSIFIVEGCRVGRKVIKNRCSKRKNFQNKSSNITFLKEKFQKFRIIK